MVCQVSATILDEAEKTQKNILNPIKTTCHQKKKYSMRIKSVFLISLVSFLDMAVLSIWCFQLYWRLLVH